MAKAAKMSVEDIVKRHKIAQRRKDDFRSLYEDAYEFALPQRNLYPGDFENNVGGRKKMTRVFDSTAISSTQRFANRLQSGIFPPQRKWCRLEAGSDIPADKRTQAQVALDKFNDKMFAVLKQSNFDIAMGEFLLDLSVGTAVMLVQPGDAVSPINFIPVPQYLVCYEEGANGQVDNVYRRMRLKGESIQQQWKDAVIDPDLQRMIDDKPTEEIELIEATVLDYETGRYGYYVIHEKTKSQLVYREKKSSPWVVSRYMKVAGEIYGRGPVLTALPDIKTLNKTKELLLKNASLAITGVYTAADDGVLNPATVKIQPGAIIPVSRNGGPQGEALKPLPRAGDFNVSQIVINDLVASIKRIMLDESLPPDNMSARSATEVVERMKELAQNLGSAFGRLINETMIPLVAKILEVMDEAGLIALPLRVNGLEVRVSPVSPLAMAQNLDEINNIMQFMQITQTMGPEGQLAINVDSTIDYVADKLGVPAVVRRTPEERQQIKDQMAQAAAQAAQAQQAMPEQGGNDQQLLEAINAG
jgi:nucleotide-binding universal stress UspA family protein